MHFPQAALETPLRQPVTKNMQIFVADVGNIGSCIVAIPGMVNSMVIVMFVSLCDISIVKPKDGEHTTSQPLGAKGFPVLQ